MRPGLVGLAVLTLTAPAAAQDAPKVVATAPAVNAVVPPGETLLSVTYDRPMQASWSFVTHDGLAFPETLGNPTLADGGRTIVVRVRLAPNTRYGVMLNSARFTNFKDVEGRPAVPHRLTFSTSDAAPAAAHHH